MVRGILIRLFQAFLTMFVLLILVFFLVRLSGDPSSYLLSPFTTPEQQARFNHDLGLDQPLPVQFAMYVGTLARGDLGTSYRMDTPVVDLISQRLPNTLELAGAAMLLILLVGVPLGIYSAYRRGGRLDAFARFLAAMGQSMPRFWVGLIVILVFAVYLHWLPAGGSGKLQNLVLPAAVMAFGAVGGLIRILRSSMLEVLDSDYIRFHRLNGIPERTILWKYALRNAGVASITYIGIILATLISGAVLVETVFVWPGVGRLMVESVEYRDFNTVQGVLLIFAVIWVTVNLVVDVLYVMLNPRLR